MAPVLNLAQELLDLGRSHLDDFRTTEGLRMLRRLVGLPAVDPDLLAHAHLLIGETYFQRADYDLAREALREVLAHDPDNADGHYLFARCNELDEEEGSDHDAFDHYEHASRLDPSDARKSSAYALQLARAGDVASGLVLLQKAYAQKVDDPIVVQNFVEGLLLDRRFDDVELVLAQIKYRCGDDEAFVTLRRRIRDRLKEAKLFDREIEEDEPAVLPFRNFATVVADEEAVELSDHERFMDEMDAITIEPMATLSMVIDEEMTLAQILKRAGGKYTHRLYDELGLLGKTRADYQRAEIARVLLQKSFLSRLLKSLTPTCVRLLKTIIQCGGYVPASVLSQNVGPKAPTSETVQELLRAGVMYLGRQKDDEVAADDAALVAVVPADVHHRLASLFKVKP
ncbi:hypothetical protein Pan216_43050 [Planctomycetes bacterium Pan216]|uniref:Uncharacterized protein n=1 Tax=Kolteria novifilia TaxID=2527975 RepID=A0A518B8W6_9BACT|nr:hypothetical protein Pan216_43050 [Planctomycetes bacterium Pan216]